MDGYGSFPGYIRNILTRYFNMRNIGWHVKYNDEIYVSIIR